MTPEFQARWQHEIDRFLWYEKQLKDEFDDRRKVTHGKCWWFYNRRLNTFMMMPEKKVPKEYIPGLSRIKHLKWYFLGTTVQGVIDEIKPGEKLSTLED